MFIDARYLLHFYNNRGQIVPKNEKRAVKQGYAS